MIVKNKKLKTDEKMMLENNKLRPTSDFYKHDRYPKKSKEKKPGSDVNHHKGEEVK